MAEQASTTLESVIRGHHIYKHLWRLLVGEMLTLEQEEGNNHDKFAVSLLKDATVIGHVPRKFSRVFWHFLRHGGTITCEVTGRKKRGKGLEIPCVYCFVGTSKMIQRVKTLTSFDEPIPPNSCPYYVNVHNNWLF